MASLARMKKVVTVRLDNERGEAIDARLATHHWQVEHIEKGLRQAEAGEFANEDEVAQSFARW